MIGDAAARAEMRHAEFVHREGKAHEGLKKSSLKVLRERKYI